MEQANTLPSRKFTWGLLFIGFCCLFGWLAMNFILLTQYTNWRHFADPAAIAGTLFMSLICSSFYAIIAAAALTWGGKRYKRIQEKKHLIKASFIPAAVLTPVLGIAGVAVMLVTPFVFATVREFIAGPNIVQVADSPDGRYQAYVIDRPSLDGPNHHLFVKDIAADQSEFVTNLPEDVDFNKEIHWSPFNDIVAFQTHFKLIVYSYEDGTSEEVTLGGERHWRENGTFWVDYNDVLKLGNLQFPEPGTLTYQLEGNPETFSVCLKK